jgi:ATP-binding cassette subfamily F protein uup
MLDRASTTVLGLDGLGCAERFADYSQWETWQQERIQITKEATTRKPLKAAASSSPAKKKLSYLEAREYAGIEQRIAEAEDMVKTRRETAEDPAIASDAGRLLQAYHELEEARKALDSLYERWHDLEEKQR